MYKPRFRPIILLSIIAALVGLYGVWWLAKLRSFKQEIAALADASAPIQVQAETYAYSGFPYRLELKAKNAVISRTRADYRVQIRSPELTLIQQPWSEQFFLGAMAKPVVTLTSTLKPDTSPITASAEGAQVSLRSTGKGVRRLSMTFSNLTSTLPWTDKKLTAKHLEVHGREFVAYAPLPAWNKNDPAPPAIFEVYVSGDGLMLARGPFQLTARAEITGDPAYPHGAARLADWAKQGGTVELRAFTLARGTISDSFARGTFALDNDMRLVGAATVDTGCPAWLYQLFDQPVPIDAPACGNVLRHHKLQAGKQGVILTRAEK